MVDRLPILLIYSRRMWRPSASPDHLHLNKKSNKIKNQPHRKLLLVLTLDRAQRLIRVQQEQKIIHLRQRHNRPYQQMRANIIYFLKGNDPDKDDKISFVILTNPLYGTIAGFDKTGGLLTYVPFGFTGQDRLAFNVIDSHGQKAMLV